MEEAHQRAASSGWVPSPPFAKHSHMFRLLQDVLDLSASGEIRSLDDDDDDDDDDDVGDDYCVCVCARARACFCACACTRTYDQYTLCDLDIR